MKRRRRSRPNSIGGQFAAYLIDMMGNPAWRTLSPSARRFLHRIEIELVNHGGRDNGQLLVTNRDFCAYGVWMGAIKPALAELVALRFIEMTPGYACANPLYGQAATGSFVAGIRCGGGQYAASSQVKKLGELRTAAEAEAAVIQQAARKDEK